MVENCGSCADMFADTDIIARKHCIEKLMDARCRLYESKNERNNGLKDYEIDDISYMIEYLDTVILLKQKQLNNIIQEVKKTHDKMMELIVAMQIDPTYVKVKDLFSEELWDKIERSPIIPDVIFNILRGHWHGKNDSQIAKELEISTKTVKKWITEAENDGFFDNKKVVE